MRTKLSKLAVSGGLVALLLPAGASGAPAGTAQPFGVLHARSTGSGPFGPVQVLGEAESEFPHVEAHGGFVHVAWNSPEQPREVRYRRSGDRGRRFSAPLDVSNNPGDSSESDVGVGGGRVVVAWEDDVAGPGGAPDPCCDDDEVVARVGGERGGRFGRSVNVSASRRGHSRDPDVAVSGRHVSLVYEEAYAGGPSDIWFRRSDDGGRTWAEPLNLSGDGDDSAEPAVAIAGGAVHVVYEDRGVDEIDGDDRLAYVRSSDGGRTFTRPVLLPVGAERGGVVALAGDGVHIAGCRRSHGLSSELFFYRSADRGATWGDAVNLSHSPGTCSKPAITAGGEQVVVAWQESMPAPPGGGADEDDVFLRRSDDGGRRFGPAQNLSATPAPSEDVSVSIDGATGDLHVIWIEG